MELIYYPDHDKRYAHIPEYLREEYPDEVRIGPFWLKRERDYKDITIEEIKEKGCWNVLLIARDVPISRACYDGGS